MIITDLPDEGKIHGIPIVWRASAFNTRFLNVSFNKTIKCREQSKIFFTSSSTWIKKLNSKRAYELNKKICSFWNTSYYKLKNVLTQFFRVSSWLSTVHGWSLFTRHFPSWANSLMKLRVLNDVRLLTINLKICFIIWHIVSFG